MSMEVEKETENKNELKNKTANIWQAQSGTLNCLSASLHCTSDTKDFSLAASASRLQCSVAFVKIKLILSVLFPFETGSNFLKCLTIQ